MRECKFLLRKHPSSGELSSPLGDFNSCRRLTSNTQFGLLAVMIDYLSLWVRSSLRLVICDRGTDPVQWQYHEWIRREKQSVIHRDKSEPR